MQTKLPLKYVKKSESYTFLLDLEKYRLKKLELHIKIIYIIEYNSIVFGEYVVAALRFDQKRLLAAFECFFGKKYDTPHTSGGNNTSMHVEAQKMCYLLKLIGIEIGDFNYSWNDRGPFSPGLLVLLRSIDSCREEVELFYNDSEEKEKYIKNVKSEIEGLRKGLDMSENCYNSEQWIEILGSLAYLSRTVLPGAGFEYVSSYLKKRKENLYTCKPEYYNDEKNKEAWDLLAAVGLIDQIA